MPDAAARPRILLTVNASTADSTLHGGGGRSGRRRTDFEALAEALDADVLDWDTADRSKFWNFLRRKVGFGPVAAALVFLHQRDYDVIWCFSEIEGLLLAFLFKLFRIRRVLFFIGTETLSFKSLFLLRWIRVWTHFTAILPTNSHQASELQRTARVPRTKIAVLPYQVDCKYFSVSSRPEQKTSAPYVVAVGLEGRDYSTLIEAVRGLDTELIIVAASHWSGRKNPLPADIPENVTIASHTYTYAELRRLYSGATLAVVPLHESPYQKGITALQEAMAMGLPVIVTRTKGQSDVVIDRRKILRSDPTLETQGGFARLLAPDRPDLQKSNGLYVGVGDITAMRRGIRYLLEEPDVANDLGAQGRRFAQEMLSLELFVERAVRLVTAGCDGQIICPEILSGVLHHELPSSRSLPLTLL
jgi:glycosyltransferase involved in cell wall biosynthesis